MNAHDEMLERMRGANPLPDVDMITDGQMAEMTLQVEQARRMGEDLPPFSLEPTKPKIRWWRPAAVFAASLLAAVAVIGGVSLLRGGESDVADAPASITTVTASATTTVTASETTMPEPPDGWNPILASTVAGVPPQQAACPTGADPSKPGPEGQNVPIPPGDDHAGAFDRHLGKMIYVDIFGQTWTFDVCTNTWEQLDTAGEAIDASLVYDIDSDLTIALGPGEFSVYDAAANEWTRPDLDVIGGSRPEGFWGVAYDPVSGMVLTTSGDAVWAFDVETARLTRIGAVPTGTQLAGYVAELDRLVFVGFDTILVDPRSGETTTAGKAPPYGEYGYGFFEAAGTVFMSRYLGPVIGVCGFDPGTLAWSRCYDEAPPEIGPFSSKVGDSMNNRVILTQSTRTALDVWTLDLATGSTHEVVTSGVIPTLDLAWEPVLATTRANAAPEPAICPAGTDPNEPGSSLQQRPGTPQGDQNGTFDRRTGHIVYVDVASQTWTFDVCTNTWHNVDPEGNPFTGSLVSLVYDVDSDVTIAFADSRISVYDSKAEAWTNPQVVAVGGSVLEWFEAAAYDPISGLVLTASADQIWAFDVATGTLTRVGSVPLRGRLAGYVFDLDRLVFVADQTTVLVDPRSGEATTLATGALPFAGWGDYAFFEAGGTVFMGAGEGAGCGFDPDTLAWDLCFPEVSPPIRGFAARVADPINGRVVLIHRSELLRDVWGFDLATGQMIQLLEPGT